MKSGFRSWPVGVLVLCTACANIGPPQPPSLQLPEPPADLRASRKGDRVTLTWGIPTQTTDRQTIRSVGPTRICRGLEPTLTDCKNPIGEAPGTATVGVKSVKPGTKRSSRPINSDSYTDALPASMESDDPNSYVSYVVEVENTKGRAAGPSNSVRVPLIRTLPPPPDFSAKVTAQGVESSWTGSIPASVPTNVSYVYRIYRRQEGRSEQVQVAEIPIDDKHNFSLIDSNIEWEKTYDYHLDVVTIINEPNKAKMEVPGADSAEIKVFAHDVFPPGVPSSVQAVSSGPGQPPFVDLIWAPDSDADLAGYNVYRREESTTPVKLNTTLVTTPAYRDSQVLPGKTYFYSVAAVDLRGNESARSEEASETVP